MKEFVQIKGPCLAVITLVALLLGLLPVQSAQALSPHDREGVIFGVGVGFSPGQATLFPGNEELAVSSDWEIGVTPQLRVGYAVMKNRLSLTVTNQQWLYEQGILAEDKLRINAQNWSLALTYYPAKRESVAGGLYILGSYGISNSRLTLLEPIENDPHGNKFEEVFKEDEGGSSYQFGAGFEFRLTRLFAAGVSVSYIHQSVGGTIFEDTSVIPLNLTLNWYW